MNQNQANELNIFAKKLLEFNDPLSYLKNSWARVYVEAEKPIPEKWRMEFYEELVSESLEYRKALEESIRWFGVRWVK